MTQSSCLNCPDRTSDCHSYCEKYKLFKAEREAENEKLRKSRSKDRDINGYQTLKNKRLGKWS